MNKDILLIKVDYLISNEACKHLHDSITKQLKSGVVIIPAYLDAEILNIPENVEVVVQPKDELVILDKQFNIYNDGGENQC